MGKYIDLHVHTTCSDGKKTVEEVIDMANENDVKFLAIADHYNLAAYEILKKIDTKDVECIPAIELGTDLSSLGIGKNHKCHILVYYPSPKISLLIDRYEMDRRQCVKKILKMLRNQGIKINYSDVVKYARDNERVGRFDIAIALSKLGFVENPIEAYGTYLDVNAKAYVQRNKMSPVNLIKFVKKTGGVCVVAHPKSLRLSYQKADEFFNLLSQHGLGGIEVYNPSNNDEQREYYLNLCKKYNLIATVGSDYHGKPDENLMIGYGNNYNLCIDDEKIIYDLKSATKR